MGTVLHGHANRRGGERSRVCSWVGTDDRGNASRTTEKGHRAATHVGARACMHNTSQPTRLRSQVYSQRMCASTQPGDRAESIAAERSAAGSESPERASLPCHSSPSHDEETFGAGIPLSSTDVAALLRVSEACAIASGIPRNIATVGKL